MLNVSHSSFLLWTFKKLNTESPRRTDAIGISERRRKKIWKFDNMLIPSNLNIFKLETIFFYEILSILLWVLLWKCYTLVCFGINWLKWHNAPKEDYWVCEALQSCYCLTIFTRWFLMENVPMLNQENAQYSLENIQENKIS